MLKPLKIQEGDYIYYRGRPIDEIYFLVTGLAGYILPEQKDFVYVKLEPEEVFGDIDYVVPNSEGKRSFTVKALMNCECYTLSKK